jgi:flagellum-specific ATP synthase
VRTLKGLRHVVEQTDTIRVTGYVTRVVGTVIEGQMADCAVGQMCHIETDSSQRVVLAEIIGFNGHNVILMPLGDMRGLHPGSRIQVVASSPRCRSDRLSSGGCSTAWESDRRQGTACVPGETPLYAEPLNPFYRRRIHEPLDVGFAPSTPC